MELNFEEIKQFCENSMIKDKFNYVYNEFKKHFTEEETQFIITQRINNKPFKKYDLLTQDIEDIILNEINKYIRERIKDLKRYEKEHKIKILNLKTAKYVLL